MEVIFFPCKFFQGIAVGSKLVQFPVQFIYIPGILAHDPFLAQDFNIVAGPADEVVAVHEQDYDREDESDNEVLGS